MHRAAKYKHSHTKLKTVSQCFIVQWKMPWYPVLYEIIKVLHVENCRLYTWNECVCIWGRAEEKWADFVSWKKSIITDNLLFESMLPLIKCPIPPHPSPPHLSLLKLINSALLINTRTLGCIERILQSADFKIVQWEVTCLTRMETRRWSDNWNRNRQISEASRYLLFWPLKQRVQNALSLNYAEHMWNCFRVSHSVVVPKPIRAGQVLVSHW